MLTHNVTVKDRVIGYPHNERVISRNVQVDAISATFDAEWAATTSVLAVFANGQTVVRVDAGYKSGKATVTVPWEVLADDGMLYVSFVGYLPGNARIVTERMKRPFIVERGGEVDGGAAANPSPDVIQEQLSAAKAATSAANTAANSANAAAGKANVAARSVDKAKAEASSAAASANAAASLANNAAANASGATAVANAAAANAMQIANNVAQGAVGSSDMAKQKQQIAELYGEIANITGEFRYSDGVIYCPSSKVSASGSALTFGSTCTASGTVITLK